MQSIEEKKYIELINLFKYKKTDYSIYGFDIIDCIHDAIIQFPDLSINELKRKVKYFRNKNLASYRNNHGLQIADLNIKSQKEVIRVKTLMKTNIEWHNKRKKYCREYNFLRRKTDPLFRERQNEYTKRYIKLKMQNPEYRKMRNKKSVDYMKKKWKENPEWREKQKAYKKEWRKRRKLLEQK